jgi:hypothetical protein
MRFPSGQWVMFDAHRKADCPVIGRMAVASEL